MLSSRMDGKKDDELAPSRSYRIIAALRSGWTLYDVVGTVSWIGE